MPRRFDVVLPLVLIDDLLHAREQIYSAVVPEPLMQTVS
jgi:hypothetical protein